MNFEQWLNTLDLANLNDLQPNDGMEMGWYACKEQVLKILNEMPYVSPRELDTIENTKFMVEKL